MLKTRFSNLVQDIRFAFDQSLYLIDLDYDVLHHRDLRNEKFG